MASSSMESIVAGGGDGASPPRGLVATKRILGRGRRRSGMQGAGLALGLFLPIACAFPSRLELRLGFDESGASTAEWRAAVEEHQESAQVWEGRALSPAEN